MPRARRTTAKKPVQRHSQRTLQYKVVELSNVDEGALERTVNEWVPQGWRLDGVQFAMRESSKRPAMAFVFFTREGPSTPLGTGKADERFRDEAAAQQHLRRLVLGPKHAAGPADPWARLSELALDGDEP